MINPGSVAGQIPPGDDALIRRIQDLERVVRELQAQDVLRTAGLVASPNLLTVQGDLDVTGTETVSGNLSVTGTETVSGNLNVTGTETVGGTLNVTGPATIGGTLGVTGTTTLGAPTTVSGTLDVSGTTTLGAPTTISGNTTVSGSLNVTGPMTVGGTLSLPAGIIDNAALANPVSVGYTSATQSNFAIGTTQGTFASATLTVPPGFTSAVIWSWAGAYVWNTGAGGTYVYLESGPAGADSGLPWAIAGGGGGITATMDGVLVESGLTAGATITIAALMKAGIAIPANSSTQAWTRVMALWFR